MAMKKKIVKSGKRSMAIVLSAAMMASGLAIPVDVSAKGALDRQDSSIVYAVDCGDVNPETVPDDGPLGTHNSVTDQVYGEDKESGYKWGIIDTTSSPLENGIPNISANCAVTDWTWPYEFTTSDQKSKTSTNRYTKNQYEKNIETRYLDYGFELENGDYYVEVGFIDPWGCSSSPSLYANKDKAGEKVLAEDFAVSSNSGVVTGNVTVTDGELTINARGTGDANKAINMTYITIKKAGDDAMVQTDYDALNIKTSGVISDLTLPTEGNGGSKITWESDNEAVITKDGKVTRPADGEEDAEVTLTATIKKGDAVLKKTFVVTVKAFNEAMGTSYFPLDAVEVTDEYYDNALELDVDNLLVLDEDRLLAGFRETAGYAAGMSADEVKAFMKNKTRYPGGWENALIGGHTLGHYMSAVAQGVVNPGLSKDDRQALKERLDSIVSALAECQEKTKGTEYEGYIFGATLPNKKDVDIQFDNVEKGAVNISTQAWVPWYTMHKILAGLVDSYTITGNKQALEVANNLATWIAKRVNSWSDATRKTTLRTEYGGMNDALYELYKVTDASNKEEFKKAAHQFDETELFETVLQGTKNAMNGKHANTTIPKFLGALCRYEVDNSETKYLQYAESFWDMVKDNHTYITGGNSEDEHFGADNVLDAERTNCNNETCNTYNMLKLSRRLFVITGDKKYADYYENTLINAIMSSQDHKTGHTMYFQPMASGYQKVFGTVDSNFWCCTGSGMENFTKLQDTIYFKKSGMVGVNLYLASKVTGDGYVIEQSGDLSKSETMTFTVSGDNINFKMKLRVPDWVKDGKVDVKFDGESYEYKVNDGYITIPNERIASGATFTVTLPMEVTTENLPDNENVYAFKYGPFVLSAKLGKEKQTTGSHGVSVTVPTTKAVSSDTIGIRSEESVKEYMKNINDNLVKAEGSMNFNLTGTNFDYTFTTHYNQDEENYGIYWNYYIDEDGRGAEEVLAEKEANRLSDATVDKMEQAGRGQYEDRFILTDGETKDGLVDNGSTGMDAPALTREANAGGSFGYKMQVAEGEDNYLLVTYAKEDDGKPMKITVGDTVITDEVLDSAKAVVDNRTLAKADQADYYQVLYKIPAGVVDANVASLEVLEENKTVTKRVITVMFAGTADKASARICKSVSMMKAYRSTNELTKLTYNGKELSAVNGRYEFTVPYTETPEVIFGIKDTAGYVELDGVAIDEKEAKKLKLTGAVTTIPVKVYAQDFKTVTSYEIVVTRDYSGLNLKDNLVKGFAFDESTDGAVAVSKSFTPPEKANATYSYEEGVEGKAITMSGSYGLKLLDDASVLGNSYTISFWMKPKSVGAMYNPTLTAGTFAPEYWLNLTLDGKLWSSNGSWVTGSSSGVDGAYTANEWQHVTAVVYGDKEGTSPDTVCGELYVNGVLINSCNVAKDIMTKTGAKVYFGVNAWDALFTGAVDEVLLFNKALSGAEVQAVAGKVVTTKTLGISGDAGNEEPSPTVKPDDENKEPSDNPAQTKKVTVKAAGYTLKNNTITLVKGKKVTLVTNAKSFTTSKKTVATVSSKGVVTAKKAGSAKITLKYGSSSKVITVKVVKKAKKNKKLVLKKAKLTVKAKKTAAIIVSKTTAGTTDTITFKSSKPKVAAVDAYGVVKAKKKGKTVITVTCGKSKKKINVTVK